DEPISQITPSCLRHPLSPMVAAEKEGVRIDLARIRKSFDKLSKAYDAIVVEGAGGLLVPINRHYFVLDLAKEFGLPLIVISRPDLGTINHTLLTVKYALKEGLRVAGIIINYTYPSEGSLAEETNPQALKQLSTAPLIGIFPYLSSMSEETLEKAVVKNLNMDVIKKYL
ncbi:MAG: dethiobiotin synthase, partial [Nitrospirae bacterium]|nr:dethiobiotin synthase [Nitrospirota bacterium]